MTSIADYNAAQASAMDEKTLQENVVDALKRYRWRYVHFLPATNEKGRWRTPYQGDDGFVDFIAIRGNRALAFELKSQSGAFRKGQQEWIDGFAMTAVEVYVWRPFDLISGEIYRVLA